jgi:uncharacterized protein (TIGR01777 family)
VRILVTGASGFIGRALAAFLAARGDEIVAVTHRTPRPGQVGIDLEAHRLDATRLPGGELGHLDAAVHLAGVPVVGRWTSKRREAIRASRIAVGDVVARALAAMPDPPSVYVTGSATGYYGERGDEVLDESSPPGEGFLASVCGAWEDAAQPAYAAGIRVVAVRSGIVLGQGGGLVETLRPLFRAGLGARLGSGRQWMPWIALSDEVGGITFAIDNPSLTGPVNLVSPAPVRNAEFTEAFADLVHRPALLGVPSLALELALGSGPAREMLLVSQRVVPARLEEAGFSFECPSLDDGLRSAVGLPPLPR